MKIITDFPYVRQTFNYDCGAKAMHAVLSYYGIDTDEGRILQIAKTTPKRGTPIHGMLKVAAHFKLKARIEKLSISKLKKHIDKDVPVILLLQAWGEVKDLKRDWKDGHYVVAIGYDKERIYFEDPSSILRLYISYQDLEERWHDIDSKGRKYVKTGIVISGPKKDFPSVVGTYVSYQEQEARWQEIDNTTKKRLKTGICISGSKKKVSCH